MDQNPRQKTEQNQDNSQNSSDERDRGIQPDFVYTHYDRGAEKLDSDFNESIEETAETQCHRPH